MSSLKKVTQKGFTIVELLIVIVVIGILAALVITTYSGIQQKGRNADRENDIKALQTQLELYYQDKNYYPSTTDLGTNSANNVTFVQANMKGLDKDALRDPKAAEGDYSLGSGTAGVLGKYQYRPMAADGTTTCDNSGSNPCVKFQLVAKIEGGDDLKKDSLN